MLFLLALLPISIASYNMSYYSSICKSFDPQCLDKSDNVINVITEKIHNITNITFSNKTILLAEAYYNKGVFSFYGITTNKPNLEIALSSFIISSYLGNPKSQYKLYYILINDLINEIITTKEYASILNSNKFLNQISKSKYYNNFNVNNDKITRTAIAMQFLYSSSLSKYQPALLTLGNKYLNGYNVEKNCNASLSYYKQSSFHLLNYKLTRQESIRLLYYISLEQLEYIKNIFEPKDPYTIDINDFIERFKLESTKKQNEYISEIGFRYLVGIGTEPNFEEALNWFNKGKSKNDPNSLYYLGEMYLNGWGVEVDYKKAYMLFTEASNLNFSRALNSLGYMYYMGYYVNKDVDKAYSYFTKSIDTNYEPDSYYDMMITALDEPKYYNIANGYQYANFVASRGHLFGIYMFAMMNHFKVGSYIDSCKITNSFFKNVAERSLDNFLLYSYALKSYMNKHYAQSFLIFGELAEMGYDKALSNSALLLRKYNILKNKKYQRSLYVKYAQSASGIDNNNIKDFYSLMLLGDYYYENKNYTKAIECYKRVANAANIKASSNKENEKDKFYVSHCAFNLGIMIRNGLGTTKNITKAEKMFSIAKKYEDLAKYPVNTLRYYEDIKEKIIKGNIKGILKYFFGNFFSSKIGVTVIITFIMFYVMFYFDLRKQK